MIKAPKVRFQPNTFGYLDGQLYCIVWVYRLSSDPHEWCYVLEERKDLSNPETYLSSLCSSISGGNASPRIIWKPISGVYDRVYINITMNDYMHGNRLVVENKEMLNKFKVVSSGEIN